MTGALPGPRLVLLDPMGGFRPTAEPVPGCTVCARLDKWRRHNDATDNPSGALDCVVEIRNHPHKPRKLTVPAHDPPPLRPGQ